MHPEDKNFDLEQKLLKEMQLGEYFASSSFNTILAGCAGFQEESSRLIGYCGVLLAAYYAATLKNNHEQYADIFMESFLIELTGVLKRLGVDNVHFQFLRIKPKGEA